MSREGLAGRSMFGWRLPAQVACILAVFVFAGATGRADDGKPASGTVLLQIEGHPKFSTQQKVDVSCYAKLTTDEPKDTVLRLAPTGTVSCEWGYKKEQDRTEDDFLLIILLPGAEPLAAGKREVKLVQIETSVARMVSWPTGAFVEFTSVKDGQATGSFALKETEWSFTADFVAEICPE